jgi:hypothetical protein
VEEGVWAVDKKAAGTFKNVTNTARRHSSSFSFVRFCSNSPSSPFSWTGMDTDFSRDATKSQSVVPARRFSPINADSFSKGSDHPRSSAGYAFTRLRVVGGRPTGRFSMLPPDRGCIRRISRCA